MVAIGRGATAPRRIRRQTRRLGATLIIAVVDAVVVVVAVGAPGSIGIGKRPLRLEGALVHVIGDTILVGVEGGTSLAIGPRVGMSAGGLIGAGVGRIGDAVLVAVRLDGGRRRQWSWGRHRLGRRRYDGRWRRHSKRDRERE